MEDFIFSHNTAEDYKKAAEMVNEPKHEEKQDTTNLSSEEQTTATEPKEQPKHEVMVNNDNMPSIPKPETKPKYQQTGDMNRDAAQVVKYAAAVKASEDEKFIEDSAKSFQKGVKNEQEGYVLDTDNETAEKYYEKWEDILSLTPLKSHKGKAVMKVKVAVLMIPYIIYTLIGFCFIFIGKIFSFINQLFTDVFGQTKEIQVDKDGHPILDKNGHPVGKVGYNIFAKIILGIIIVAIILLLVVAIIKVFTGFDFIEWVSSLIAK